MRVTILGCGTSSGVPMIGCRCPVCTSGEPRNRRRRCAILIDEGATRVLVDTPPDLRCQLLDAGVDRVMDFRAADGDRVLLDAGTSYTLAQVGADTVVSMVGGGQVVLVGVQLASLPAGWIFGA